MATELDMKEFARAGAFVNPWLLGADPEFAVISPPDKMVPNAGAFATEVVCSDGGIGQDHGGRVWEVRPAPSPSAYALVENIWKLLRHAQLERVEKFKWKGGALGGRKNSPQEAVQLANGSTINHAPAPVYDTLGGHVHFGIAGFNGQQRKALDAVTLGMLNLDILPLKENTKRQSYGAYGRFTHDATRDCNGHIEYRCAPSWLDKPGQALAALTIYKLAAAKPSTVEWPTSYAIKRGLLEWVDEFSQVDVDAWLLHRIINQRGFESVQADPESNFRPLWRREALWAR